MQETFERLCALVGAFGAGKVALVATVIAVVQLIKRPIVRLAEKKAACGVDKSVITRYVSALPVVVAFIIEAAVALIRGGFDFAAIDAGALLRAAAADGALAVAVYECAKKQLEAYAAKKNAGGASALPDKKRDSDGSASLGGTAEENGTENGAANSVAAENVATEESGAENGATDEKAQEETRIMFEANGR